MYPQDVIIAEAVLLWQFLQCANPRIHRLRHGIGSMDDDRVGWIPV